jgi:hypothetical protein
MAVFAPFVGHKQDLYGSTIFQRGRKEGVVPALGGTSGRSDDRFIGRIAGERIGR